MTREKAFHIIMNNGIVLHDCNKYDKKPGNDTDIFYLSNDEMTILLRDECKVNDTVINNADDIFNFKNRYIRYAMYDEIDSLIEKNKDIYYIGIHLEQSYYLDRLDSEIQKTFVIRSDFFDGAICFDSVNEFKDFIEG